MKVKTAEYVKSFSRFQSIDIPERPAVAFIGRSNVGKSSLINSLVSRRRLVKTSATPGKTQLMNFFLINEQFYFIDLPGYGFANVPVAVKTTWLEMIQEFLRRYRMLKLVIQLVDIRHPPTRFDIEFRAYLLKLQLPHLIVANKSDQLKRSQMPKALALIASELKLSQPPLPHSFPKKAGQVEIWRAIQTQLDAGGVRDNPDLGEPLSDQSNEPEASSVSSPSPSSPGPCRSQKASGSVPGV